MRISDWSSDVCSSDLPDHQLPLYISRASRKTRSIRSLPAPMRVDPSQRGPETNMNQWGVKIYRATKKARRGTLGGPFRSFVERGKDQSSLPAFSASPRMSPSDAPESAHPDCAPSDRKRAGEGQAVSVRVDIGGGRNI